jgi:uncharacterized protein YutE (UPF0331/DUF86 family)
MIKIIHQQKELIQKGIKKMRSREEIEKELEKRYYSHTPEGLQLEVLLDIRDMLAAKLNYDKPKEDYQNKLATLADLEFRDRNS